MRQAASRIPLILLILFAGCSIGPSQEESQPDSAADSVTHYGDLALSYYNSGNLLKSRTLYLKMMEFKQPDSMRLQDVILRKRLFFVPDTFLVPEQLIHEHFVLKPLKAIHAELDYQAVMSSVDHLTGVIGRRDWPGDLTLEEDRVALAGHEWEFENRTGFVYTVMNMAETEVIGCVYIYPSRLDDFDTEVVLWVTENEFDKGTDKVLFDAVALWLDTMWPFEHIIYPGREIRWGEFFETLDRQDQKYAK